GALISQFVDRLRRVAQPAFQTPELHVQREDEFLVEAHMDISVFEPAHVEEHCPLVRFVYVEELSSLAARPFLAAGPVNVARTRVAAEAEVARDRQQISDEVRAALFQSPVEAV